jgi:hypothetical protein
MGNGGIGEPDELDLVGGDVSVDIGGVGRFARSGGMG